MSRPRPEALRGVLFDWDGTLVDSAETSFRAYASLFSAFGIPFDRDPRERWEEADAHWLRLYAEERNQLLPGVREALLAIRRKGHVQGIVSSGERSRVTFEMHDLEVGEFFSEIVCGGDTPRRKPHPEPLLVALERMGLGPAEVAYVGDSPEDVEMARGAGVFAVGVPGPFPNRDGLVASNPDLLAPDLRVAIAHLVK
jgi:HAD superfamily hydrolase (TIGR01549 family)